MFEDAWDRDELDSSDPTLYWMQRLESAMSRALSTLMQRKYDRENAEMPTWLPTMIKHFDEEINVIKLKSLPHLCTLLLLHAALSSLLYIRILICIYNISQHMVHSHAPSPRSVLLLQPPTECEFNPTNRGLLYCLLLYRNSADTRSAR